jgi:hypothetical protein
LYPMFRPGSRGLKPPPVVVLAEGMTGSLAKPPLWRTDAAAFTAARVIRHGFDTVEAKAERRSVRAALVGLRAALARVD